MLGIIGIPTCWTGLVPLLGLIFGIIGYTKTTNEGGGGRGLAIAGMICSGVALLASGAWLFGLFH